MIEPTLSRLPGCFVISGILLFHSLMSFDSLTAITLGVCSAEKEAAQQEVRGKEKELPGDITKNSTFEDVVVIDASRYVCT